MKRDPEKPSKSERTRQRIRLAAEKLFAERGYERATVRDIADLAEIDATMVIRYFGSKDALFAETAAFDLAFPALGDLPPQARAEAAIRHFLSRWEGGAEDSGLAVLLRSAASNALAAGRMRAVFADQLTPVLAQFVPAGEVQSRSVLLASQMLGLAFCRYILKLEPLASMSVDEIVALLTPQLRTILAPSGD